MKYESTRGSKTLQSSTGAIIRGIAEDRGLYVPVSVPKLPLSVAAMKGMTYQQIAFHVIGAFFDEYTEDELRDIVARAYDSKFEAPQVVPLVKAGKAWFLELYHGRTAAFKDMALSILPHLMTTACRKEGETDKICILTATSGDTGKAALEGFADVEGTEIVVFYPHGGVSQVQERQMVSQEGKNTHVYAIEGNFDDAQTGVKKLFADEELAARLGSLGVKLSSANSINIGRLVPQVAYYVYSYVKMVENGALKDGEPMNIVVPTGNFGNILAAYLAGEMGISIGKLICASNENKVLTDFLASGVYDTHRDFHVTNSPSMDILVSSNLERLLYLLSGRDGQLVASLMNDLETSGRYQAPAALRAKLSAFYGGYCTQYETLETIGAMWRENGYLIDTHTAVAYKVYEDYLAATGDERPAVIAATASAYKFAADVARAIGLDESKVRVLAGASGEVTGFDYVKALEKATSVRVPQGLAGLENKPVRHQNVCAAAAMKDAVLESLHAI